MDQVTVRNGLVYVGSQLVGVIVNHDLPNAQTVLPAGAKDPIKVVFAKDQEEFEQLTFYQWRANANARKMEIQRKYNKGTNNIYEHLLKPMDEWMSKDDYKISTELRSLLRRPED